ncbi:alpha/beta hydrolase [Herbidospora mongoliensis]|uniref:alpha/beta hydrolase n=1 Tax=Herbidospora mongoliensis TaxID=688067 RepID=UPI0008296EDB|nr:alpha/beta fold hydrolase [Herbidospora mongoliensis]
MKTAFVSALLALASVAALTPVGSPAEAVTRATAAPAMTASAATVAGLQPCKDLEAMPTARCGVLTLPLDRRNPAKGTTPVAFALIPHTDTSKPGLGTIVPNPGGPGDSAIDLAGALFADGFASLSDRRDLLLIDPRGVGRSGAITCPALAGPDRAFVGLERQRAMIGECGEQLGERVGDYGTAAFADDIDAVRARLGVDRLDLVGVSYGTYLMPVYAQRHPTRVRTISLAGAYAVNTNPIGTGDVAAFRRAVRLVCQRTEKCSGTTVLNDIAALAKRLRANPAQVDVTYAGTTHNVVLDEWRMTSTAAGVYASEADIDTALALASAAAAARRGNLEPFRELVRDDLTTTAEAFTKGSELYSDTLSWAATCHDYPRDFDYADSLSTRRADYDRVQSRLSAKDFAPFSPKAWVTRADYDTAACLNWPNDPTAKSPLPRGAKLPNVPVLVLSGDLDANTTSLAGRQAAAQFPRATFKEYKNVGHTPGTAPEGVVDILSFIVAGRA